MEISIVLLAIAIIFVIRAIRIVPQQSAWVVERLGKYTSTLSPGLKFRWTFPAKFVSPATTPNSRSTASCTSK
jgi:regulator of protease activity HflC (stomatin/prohibitin superfamily)